MDVGITKIPQLFKNPRENAPKCCFENGLVCDAPQHSHISWNRQVNNRLYRMKNRLISGFGHLLVIEMFY